MTGECSIGPTNEHLRTEPSGKHIPPETPFLYSKTGVPRGTPIFLICAPKHRLWVLIRTASSVLQGGSSVYPQSIF